MSIKLRVFISFFVTIFFALALIVRLVFSDLEPRYRETIEEPLVDASRLVAAMIEVESGKGPIKAKTFSESLARATSRPFSAIIYDHEKTSVDLRAYLTDKSGKVLFDSHEAEAVGSDYSEWRDVKLTLEGGYGSRTSRDLPENKDTSIMYIAAPIMNGEEVKGVLTLGKPTKSFKIFIEKAKERLVWSALGILSLALVAGYLLARLLTRPIENLTGYALAVADGKRPNIPRLPKGEISSLGKAFEHMRQSLEGKNYIERYVETLTHEVKSPLSAIRGAAELLTEPMSEVDRGRFLSNIRTDAERLQVLVDKLLLLSQLEARARIEDKTSVDLNTMLKQLADALSARLSAKSLELKISGEAPEIKGDIFLIEHALRNLLDNAIDFAPSGSTISVALEATAQEVWVTVRDQGPGVPDYALLKVFDRFYSLERPGTNRKSTGLGLSLVREVAELHGGSATLVNLPGGGAQARITLKIR